MEKLSYEKDILRLASFLKTLWKNETPLFKLFRTDKKGYIYDTGTNKIAECTNREFILLNKAQSVNIDHAITFMNRDNKKKDILNTLQSIISSIQRENILKLKRAAQFNLPSDYADLEEPIKNELNMIILEITEECNLRCEYCIYNPSSTTKRNHGKRKMSLSCAYSAIRYLKDHSKSRAEVGIGFYGGEPLLRFSFIRSCVEYANVVLKGKQINFNITTNGTLLSYQVAKYFYDKNFTVLV